MERGEQVRPEQEPISIAAGAGAGAGVGAAVERILRLLLENTLEWREAVKTNAEVVDRNTRQVALDGGCLHRTRRKAGLEVKGNQGPTTTARCRGRGITPIPWPSNRPEPGLVWARAKQALVCLRGLSPGQGPPQLDTVVASTGGSRKGAWCRTLLAVSAVSAVRNRKWVARTTLVASNSTSNININSTTSTTVSSSNNSTSPPHSRVLVEAPRGSIKGAEEEEERHTPGVVRLPGEVSA